MFNFGAATPSNTSLFGQSTPINQTRTGGNFLSGNTTAQPLALTSTPFPSSSTFGAATPSTTFLQAPSAGGTGTVHKFDPVIGSEKITKNNTSTSVRTKLYNICGMPVYEKKSMEELRLEDYVDNRKFASATSSLFPSASTSSNTPLFGGLAAATSASSTLGMSLFGNKPMASTAPTLSFPFGGTAATTAATPFSFGAPATTTAATAATPFSFGGSTTTNPIAPFGSVAPATSTLPFAFGSSQAAPATTTTPAFSFGGSTPFMPATSSAAPATGTSFGFATAKPAATGTFSFTPSTGTTAPPAFSLFPSTAPTAAAAPTLFSTMNQPTATNTPAFSTQSSVDTRTHLQLFQTMLNIQPFNSELAFLARNIKPNIGLDRARLRTAPDPSAVHPVNSVFSPLLNKPSLLTSSTVTPPSTIVNPLQTHSHTLPSVLLAGSTAATTGTLNLFGKRKLADSFLDDDDDNSLMMDDGPSSSINRIPKGNLIKRPRVLDMNKIRSVVLGGGGGGGVSVSQEVITKDDEFSDTYVVKPAADHLAGWKKFATYEAYRASKTPSVASVQVLDDRDDKQSHANENKRHQERAFHLPRLTHDDYYTEPRIDELRHRFNDQGECIVKEFTVGREHYGSVKFRGARINLAGLDLDRLIEIGRRQVTVYPDENDKPAEGEELNCQAIISLLGVYPIDRSISNSGEEVTDPDRLVDMNYGHYLREMTKKFDGKFIDYDVRTGTWKFQVEHF